MASPELRAGDADREAVAARLRAAHAAGQLDVDEVEQRLAEAYAARTFGDLAPLTADLGPVPVPPPPSKAKLKRRREVREWASVAIIVNAIWIVTCIAAGSLLFYWPIFPVGIWGAVILAGVLFGDDEPSKLGRGGGHGTLGHGGAHGLHPPEPPKPPEPPRLP